MQPNSPLITLSPSSPSFNSYSSNKLAEIAARVVQEFSNDQSQDHHPSDVFSWHPQQVPLISPPDDQERKEEEEEEEEFEFAMVCSEPVDSPISADDIFYNGQIRPMYPLFNMSLLSDKEEESTSKPSEKTTAKPTRLPLRKLFSEEREYASTTSCSSSEADELENVPAETYCVWNPKKAAKDEESGHDMCKKSSSTGSSSKRWKLRDLLYRSNSDGKDTFVFLDSKKTGERKVNVEDKSKEAKGSGGGLVGEHYVRCRAVKEGDKRRSFLPYRQDLVGFFSNANGFTRNLHPF